MPRLRRVSARLARLGASPPGQGVRLRRRATVGALGADDVARCKALVIPPAWEQVWICPAPNGHIQAVGTDDAGRRQYLYHPVWREQRDKAKHDRVLTVAARLPKARKVVRQHLALPGMPRERALGTAFRLLDLGFFRVGGEQYAEDNGSYGLATIEKQHVTVTGDEVVFEYLAKSGQERLVAVADAAVIATPCRRCARRRGGGPRAARLPGRAALARHLVRRHQPLRQGRRRRRRVGQGLPHVARHRARRGRPRRIGRRGGSPTRRKQAVRAAMVEVARRTSATRRPSPGARTSIPASSTCTRAATTIAPTLRRLGRRRRDADDDPARPSSGPCCGCCALTSH